MSARSLMRRRTFLGLGASAAVLAVLPRAIRSVRARFFRQTVGATLTPNEMATVSAYADALLPRTETPGALDVGVPAFVAFINAKNYGSAERDLMAQAFTHLDDVADRVANTRFASLQGEQRQQAMRILESPTNDAPSPRGYLQLRRLVLHGYFTSEVVQKQVLHTVVMPGRFDGDVPMTAATPDPSRRAG